jgi:hypothetical protein
MRKSFLVGLVSESCSCRRCSYGDPSLTLIDCLARKGTVLFLARWASYRREMAEGPAVPDRIVEGRRFDGKGADFVLIASRRKEGWEAGCGVHVGPHRRRLAEPFEVHIEGRLRTCYPLYLVRDGQIDRRILFYRWPDNAPLLPDFSENQREA